MGSYLNMLSARRLGSRSSDELLSSIQNQNQSQTAVESSAPASTKASKVQTLPTVGKTAGEARASAQLQAERSLPVLQAATSAAAQRGASLLPLVRSGEDEPSSVLERSMQVLPGIRQAVNTYTQSGTGRSRLLEERVTNTQRTIRRLEDQLAAARAQEQAREADLSVAYVTPQTGGTAAVERQLSDLRAALPIYRQEAYDALARRADFSSRSSGLTAAEIAEQVHQDQGGTLGAVARGLSPALNFGSEPSKSPAAYTLLTEEETANYNYLRNTQGEEAARAYLDFLEERVNQREGERSAQRVREEENPILRTLNTAGTAARAGLDQFSTGLRQIGRTEALATSPEQFASAAVREDLAETGPKLGGNSLGQIGYDAVSTLANMAPSLAAGTLNPVAGAALMSASSGGNAYGEALKEGFTPEQAARYGTLTAAAEGALSYLLGGISALGGKATGHIAQQTIQSIDNALARAAVELGVHMAGEGTEEYLQEILTPVFRNLALDENNEFKPVTEEALYAGLLGALTAGLLEGGPALSSAVGEITANRTDGTGRTAETQAVLLPTAQPEAVTLPVAGRESGDMSQPPTQQNAPDAAGTGQESAVPAGETERSNETALADFVARELNGDRKPLTQVAQRIQQTFGEADAQTAQSLRALIEQGSLSVDAAGNLYPTIPENHIDNRTMEEVGSRRVNAFQFDHPALHPYFAEAAGELLQDLSNSVPGERWSVEAYNPYSDVVQTTWKGSKRHTTQQIASLLDHQRLSYADIQRAAEAIYHNHGQENYAAAKRVELILDDMLSNGWTDATGRRHEANQDYLAAKQAIPGAREVDSGGILDNVDQEKPAVDNPAGETYDRDTAGETPSWSDQAARELAPDGSPLYARNREEANIQPTDLRALRKRQQETAQRLGMEGTEASRLEGYVQGLFSYTFNRRMEAGTLNASEQAIAADIMRALSKFPTYEGRTYRNLRFRTEADYDAFLAEYAKGTQVTLRAFTSTSKRPNGYPLFGEGVVHMVVDGRSGRDIADTYGFPRQQEVTYLPGTELEVTQVSTANDGNPLIYLQEVTNDGKLGDEGGETDGDRGPEEGLYRHSDRPGAQGGRNGEAGPYVHGETQRGFIRDGLLSERRAGSDTGRVLVEERPESSVGAARAGFDPYTRMVNEYGAIPEGENPARVVDVPRSTDGNDRVSRTARTVMEADATPEGALGDVGQAVTEGRLSYLPIGNQETAQQARAAIEEKGFETALRDWTAQVRSGRSSAALTAQGAQLYNAAVNAGDTRLALDILTDYAANVREAAQAVQAARILKTLTPDGQLYLVQRSVQNLQEELNRRYGDGTHTLTIDEGLAEAYRNAETEEAREQALTDIYRQVAAQVPATWRDKWNAWRYLAMLGNPRTHVRNIGGNVAFMPVRMMKDAIATVGEQAVDVLSPRGIQRTKAPLNLASQNDRALLRAVWQDAGTMQDQILGAGKYRDSAQSQIDQYRTIFRLAPLEGLRRANSRALDVEDTWFSRPAYAGALAGYLKANGATLETAGTELLDRARAYAVREAQRATYRDSNAFSDFISSLGYRGDNRVGQAFNTLMEGVLPFRRTPANILVRGMEYSPLGLAKSLTYDLAQVRARKQTAAEAIDHIAAGLTGTGLTALGAFLASLGLVSGGSGDDEEDQLDELTGGQPYALTIGDKNYTLDWLAPEALPFFVGVELYHAWGEEGSGRTMDDLYTALGSISEPMLEMSMLQSLQDVIDSVSYSDNKLMGLLASAATNYLTQAFPTLFGQIERVTEGERQSTYIDRTSPLSNDLQYTLGQVANKLPGEFQQMPYFDAWGRTESSGGVGERMVNNFLAPWYTSTENETAADRELRRLLEAGETGVVPQRPSQSDQVEGEYLSRESFATYAQTMGQTSYELVSDLIGAPEYRTLSDGEKADAIALAYDYARAVGKEAVSDYQPEGWIAKAQDSGVDPADYILYRVGADAYDADGSGGLSIGERAQAMEQAGFTQEEQTLLWLMEYPDWAEAADKAGVSDSVYVAYKTATYGLTADKDAEGNSISGSKKTKVLAAIDALDIPAEEKDKLYFAAGYGASSLNEAPWR